MSEEAERGGKRGREVLLKVSFGVSLGAILLKREDTQKFMDLVKMADDYGVEALGTYDSAFIGGDAYVRTTLMALASGRA